MTDINDSIDVDALIDLGQEAGVCYGFGAGPLGLLTKKRVGYLLPWTAYKSPRIISSLI